MSDSPPWLIVGLGNPGERYAKNRHNIGFMVVDAFAERAGLGAFQKKHRGDLASGTFGGERVYVLKPLTYMNLSGDSVVKASTFFSVPPSRVLVVHDEVDLDFGRIRIKIGGGHGGHNGLRSIHAQLKTDQYLRLRMGIGRATPKGDVTPHVLSDFSKAEQKVLSEEIIPKAVDALEVILTRGPKAAMNEFHGEKKQKAKEPEQEKPTE